MKTKVVFITGAAGGIGWEVAKQFAKEGHTVIISDLDKIKLDAAAAAFRDQGLHIDNVFCDVTSEKQIQDALDEVCRKYGTIDILVNNAGFQYVSPVEEFPAEKFELLFRVMVLGTFIASKHVFPMMKAQKFGRIINLASIMGVVAAAGKAGYVSAKHAIVGLTKVLALEGAAYNVTANAICPGFVDTELVQNQLPDLGRARNIPAEKVLEELIYPSIPQQRLLSATEIAQYILFIASEKAEGITGQSLLIDGGYTIQ